jgi:hypothetical protein
MNATLAVELPFSTATVATTIPLAYIDPPVERLDAIKDGETQIWKITHNGVDSHPVHFHLVNVQVINRVAWDGTIRPPEPNEVGWKETLRMNPLEDVYVAVKAVRPVVPFGVPTSNRLLDPSQTTGSQLGFTQIDPTTGQAPTQPYSNVLASFDNEYVWHCHILGHEEQDFMRPFVFHPNVVVPDAPAKVTVSGSTVSWTDTTPYGGQDAEGIPTAGTNAAYPTPTSSPKNEIGFKVFNGATWVATVPANVTSWTDPSVSAANTYSVIAYNAAGASVAGNSTTTTSAGDLIGVGVVTAPTSTAGAAPAAQAGPGGLTVNPTNTTQATLSWTAVAGATDYLINGSAAAVSCDAGTGICTTNVTTTAGTNSFAVSAQTLSGTTAAAAISLYNGTAYRPVALTSSQGNQGNGSPPGSITLTWANNPLNVNNVSGLTLTWRRVGGPPATNGSLTFAPDVTGATIINLARDVNYNFTLLANSANGNSPAASVTGLSAP